MSEPKPRIGFLGLGTMGTPMASNLLKAKFPVTVWNRTIAKAEPLKALGATVGESAAQVASDAEIIVTMVSQPKDVEQVVLGPNGVAQGIKAGSVLIDMSTVSPSTSRKLSSAMATKGAEFLDAPVVGSKGPATDGSLVILVGGSSSTLDRCRPLFEAMGKTIIHAGDVGKGSVLKLATNLMLAHLAAGFAEGLLMVQRSGVDAKRYLEVLEASTFKSPWFQTKGVGMIKRDFSTHFALKHMYKDARLMGVLAIDEKLKLPVTKAIEQLFAQADAGGKSELDYSAILGFLEEQSGR